MKQELKDALNAVEITQDELLDIADTIVKEYFPYLVDFAEGRCILAELWSLYLH